MRQTRFIVQDCLTRGIDPAPAAAGAGAALTRLAGAPDMDDLARLEASVLASGDKPVVFCSLPVAARIGRACPALSAGLALPRDFLHHAAYTAMLRPEDLVNPVGLYLPWGRIPDRAGMLASLFPDGLFLRPNAPHKPFPGFAVSHDALAFEIEARNQTDRVDPGELVFVAPRRDLARIEYRFWILDGEPATAASYSWLGAEEPAHRIPTAVRDAASDIARRLYTREQVYTADLVLDEGTPKLVELNALSTSGWYPGIDLEALFHAADEIFL